MMRNQNKSMGVRSAFLLIMVVILMTEFAGKVQTLPEDQPTTRISVKAMGTHFSAGFFQSKQFNSTIPYRIKIPQTPDASSAPLPVFLLLHGSGERGRDNGKQLTHFNLLWKDSTDLDDFPAIVVIPQCAENTRWVETDWKADGHAMPANISPQLGIAFELLQDVLSNCNADSTRVYLVGLSMGGFAVWDLLSRYPETFAAAVPVCGGADTNMAARFAHVPLWVFHGSKDAIVLPRRSRDIVAKLRALGSKVKYTEYPDVEHGSWHRAFREPGLIPWLFAQQREK